MLKKFGIAVLCVFILGNQQQPQQPAVVTVVVKGVIVAYHGQDRAFNVEENRPIGQMVERWIVRVNDSQPKTSGPVVLVQYQRLQETA